VRCNNDHGFSPDGTRIILSSHTQRGSEIFVMPLTGGVPAPVTRNAPSWWHGWSPDGARIVYAAARGGRVVDIWSCPASGGEEQRLTFGEGHSDGPDYAPDGAWIYYNCDRTGHAQIWRVRPDGTGHEQLFADSFVNWFPHPSPDGRHVLYLAYPPGTEGHPRDRDVALVLMEPDGGNRRTLAAFNGGQGSINVPCWSPDGSAFAFMRYAAPETA
jgi:Tol biopolymer transport system component